MSYLKCHAVLALFAGLILSAPRLAAQTTLTADGRTDTYTLITNVLGAGPEVPDCSHPDFGPHITQAMDSELGKYVFQFHAHSKIDNDRCVGTDRQRIELKTDGSSPAAIRAAAGDTMNFRWRFKLDKAYQASSRFTHIHQIKAGDGRDGAPLITYSTSTGNVFKIGYTPDSGPGATLKSMELTPFLGTWVQANEKVTFAGHGSFSTTLTRVSDGAVLLTYSNPDIDLLRRGTTIYRPKIGIYRSVLDREALRDEIVLFDQLCIAKAPLVCDGRPAPRLSPAELKAIESARPAADFSIALTPGAQKVKVGDSTTFQAAITPLKGFKGSVSFSAGGVPPGVLISFNPSKLENGSGTTTVTMTMSPGTLDRKVTVSVTGKSGSVVRTGAVTLDVRPASASGAAGAGGE